MRPEPPGGHASLRGEKCDPLRTFQDLLEQARLVCKVDPTAVILATADPRGRPSARVVLLKTVDDHGFVFYTNYSGRKAAHLESNARAALCFYWPDTTVQVRIEGPTERTAAAESDAYFATRPRKSQLGAWASRQSRRLPTRLWLIARYFYYGLLFLGRVVPRPSYWGGYRLAPGRCEFWYGHDAMFVEHVRYVRGGEGWVVEQPRHLRP